MVYTNMELGTNNSNNKRKIMKELNIKMKPPSVRKYIDEGYKRYLNSESPKTKWDSCSNYELENNVDSLYEYIHVNNKILVETLEGIHHVDFEITPTLIDFIKDEEWRLVYNTLKSMCEEIDFDEGDLDVIEQVVYDLEDLISSINTIYSLKELLIKRSGLIEDITYKSK